MVKVSARGVERTNHGPITSVIDHPVTVAAKGCNIRDNSRDDIVLPGAARSGAACRRYWQVGDLSCHVTHHFLASTIITTTGRWSGNMPRPKVHESQRQRAAEGECIVCGAE